MPVICYSVFNTSDFSTVGIAMETYGLTVIFPGNTVNTYEHNDSTDVYATITNNGNSWVADSVLTINVTEFGPVGGRINKSQWYF